jgi:GT2 family glycosyltransferase
MISIVIPNYNGRQLLEKYVPGVLEAAGREGPAEVILVDDASTDGSADFVAREFPEARLVALERNAGFGRACMAGAEAASGEILVLLNSDVSVEPGFLAPLREALDDETVFAVSAIDLELSSPGDVVEARSPSFRRGFLRVSRRRPKGPPPHETIFVPGGYSAYRKDLFFALGGFDSMYEPFYAEDLDLCYRAWKRGWRSLVEPRSRVRHFHESGSIKSNYGEARARAMTRRNLFLLVWKNVTSRRMLVRRHILPMALRATFGWMVLDFKYSLPLLRALGRLGAALGRRREELEAAKSSFKYTDEDLFARLGGDAS